MGFGLCRQASEQPDKSFGPSHVERSEGRLGGSALKAGSTHVL